MSIAAIIVNYFTENFLSELLNILQKEDCIDQIVIADNGSLNDLREITGSFSKVKVKTMPHNPGFGAAINRVAEQYPAEYFLVINPDTLPDTGFARHLLEGAKQTNALLAGPRFYWDNEKKFKLPPALGYSWKTHFDMHLLQDGSPDAKLVGDNWICRHERFWNADEPFAEPFLSGGCLLIKNDRKFFADGKIFDERFFLYYEETDLCFRAIAQNQTIVVIPKAEVVHYWDQSPSNEKGRLMAESHSKFMLKHYGKIPDFEVPSKIILPGAGIQDLGVITASTKFFIQYNYFAQKLSFEIGLSPHFIPFAQANLPGQFFPIPESIINHLKPGEYFSRVRNALNQTLKIWKWKKL
jgi:GT2 family glycosyltransferase